MFTFLLFTYAALWLRAERTCNRQHLHTLGWGVTPPHFYYLL